MIRQHGKFPGLAPDRDLLTKIGKVIEGNIIDNIARQIQASGAALKRNKPSTSRRKRASGQTWRGIVMSLVAQMRRFVQPGGRSWRSVIDKNSVAVMPATGELALISGYVQRKGYTGWFGISRKGGAAIRLVVGDWIKGQFKKATRR